MELYIQSCGLSVEHDYRWLKINSNSQLPENPSILTRNLHSYSVKLTDLIQSESFSVVLARDSGELVLLVTGLEASQRKDFRGRKVRNSCAWVCQDDSHSTGNNERYLRAIAICALTGKLTAKIDQLVNFGGDYGFQMAFSDHIADSQEIKNGIPSVHCQIGKNTEKSRKELAAELQYSSLPKEDGVLVVVTGIKKESNLQSAGVWRGLSNLVDGEGWKSPYKKSFSSEESSKPPEKNLLNSPFFFMVIIVATSIFLVIFT